MSTNLPSTESDNKYLRLYVVDVLQSRLYGAILAAAEFRKSSCLLTRKDLAARAGKNEATVSRDFASPRNWTIKTLAEYCFALDIEMQFVFTDRSEPERLFTDVGMTCRPVHPAQRVDPYEQEDGGNYNLKHSSRRSVFHGLREHKWDPVYILPTAPIENYLVFRMEAGDDNG